MSFFAIPRALSSSVRPRVLVNQGASAFVGLKAPSLLPHPRRSGLGSPSSSPLTPVASVVPTTAPPSSSTPTVAHAATSAVNFTDYQKAFAAKSTGDILRSIVVFRLCAWQFLVSNAAKILNLSTRVFGRTLTMAVVKHSFFAHFCAGETGEDIMPTVRRLQSSGVGSILDYAAEADLGKPVDVEPTGRLHSEEIEEHECDANVKIFLDCIKAASQFEHGFAAVKVTALGRPALLERLTVILQQIRDLFMKFDKSGHREIDLEQFRQALDELGLDLQPQHIEELFKSFDTNQSGKIDYLEWTEYLKVEDLRTRPFFTEKHRKAKISAADLGPALPCLTDAELEQVDRMAARLETIAAAAAKARVRLMIDAEQTYFQPAISHAVINLQRKYNREFPAVFTTYQCYLKDTMQQVQDDMERARRENFWFAAKLVRGAYMNLERQRAKDQKYADPIWPTIQDTHKCYHNCLELVLRSINRSNVMVASHNQTTMELSVSLMDQLKIDKRTGGVYFGQLLGMSDHLSFTLGQNGYRAYKYVPYGPVHEVVPYLLRRAEENSSLLASDATRTERVLLVKELKRRLKLEKA